MIVQECFFWNRARSWLTLEEHWVDPQKAYDVFRTKVLEYMCDNNTWICCTAGVMDVTCGSPPATMQELVYILMDPTQNMPVLFLYWWCTQYISSSARVGDSGVKIPNCQQAITSAGESSSNGNMAIGVSVADRILFGGVRNFEVQDIKES
ncbi:unnamed protein product [Rodentolepis nana]|uniref:GH10 domain-containing protein n=1 Tax=Rodentolepis nana TaxID=102285 RepID=A0A0R3TYU5_RODNA|nr:unnamed protein product [Rodentolepis nana]